MNQTVPLKKRAFYWNGKIKAFVLKNRKKSLPSVTENMLCQSKILSYSEKAWPKVHISLHKLHMSQIFYKGKKRKNKDANGDRR